MPDAWVAKQLLRRPFPEPPWQDTNDRAALDQRSGAGTSNTPRSLLTVGGSLPGASSLRWRRCARDSHAAKVHRPDHVDRGLDREQNRPDEEEPIGSGGQRPVEEKHAAAHKAQRSAEVDCRANDLVTPIDLEMARGEVVEQRVKEFHGVKALPAVGAT